MKAIRMCLVCNQDGAKQTRLPSGAVAELCDKCGGDRFRLAEAERRVASAGAGQ